MEEPVLQGMHSGTRRRLKFPRTRRERFLEDGRLHELIVSGPVQPSRFGPEPPLIYNAGVPVGTYPLTPTQTDFIPTQHNVKWADQPPSSSGDGETVTDDSSDESDGHSPQIDKPDKPSQEPSAALAGTTMPTGRVVSDSVSDGKPRAWMQIAKTDEDDGPPVLGPPGRTPPPGRKNFKFPEELEDDDDVFYDETVPEVVFNDEIHHPAYGQYIPGQYQHTLNYLYGLHTIQEADESMLNQDTFREKASSWDIFVVTLTLIGYFVNIGADIWLAYEYLILKHYIWFSMTLAFTVLPSIAMTAFSLILYIQDNKVLDLKVSKLRWFIRSIFLVLLLAPAMRIIDTLHYGLKSRRCEDWRMRRRNYELMRDEDTDACLVRLFETFLENAPQLVLQLYVVVHLGSTEGTFLVAVQILGLTTSLTTMAWSLVTFQSALRSSLQDKAEMIRLGKLCMFVWRLMTISARVIAFAMFASYFEAYLFAVIGGHFILMFVWMARQKTMYCMVQMVDDDGLSKVHHSACLEFCFRVMAAFVHIFCFFNLLEGHTRLRCLVYYTVVYMENAVLILSWNILASTLGHGGWYATPAVGMVMGGFFLGILFQIIYYLWFHPNKWSKLHRHRRIRLWVPLSELSLFSDTGFADQAEQKPVLIEEGERKPAPAAPLPRSTFGSTAVSSSIGPIFPMETSTPAPSLVGMSPPYKPAKDCGITATVDLSPQSVDTDTTAITPTMSGPYVPIQALPNTPAAPSTTQKPIPAPRQSRPTTPALELESAPRSRPTTPARELETAPRSRPTTPARDLENAQHSRPTTPARELEIRGEFEPKSPDADKGDKCETEV